MTSTTTQLPTFEVSRAGLAKLLERRGGKAFAVTELIQNGWDQDVTRVDVEFKNVSRGVYELTVTDDDPEGFADLAHAYTLFAESTKKGDPTKRGRFNLGEKFVIAICDNALIETTKGAVAFTDDSRTHIPRRKRDAGSRFFGTIRMTKDEAAQVDAVVHALIPPAGIVTTYNGVELFGRVPLVSFESPLQTEWADADGILRRSTRKTTVAVYEPLEGETPSIYELGIPVVETGDRWHVDIAQKVPLDMDRSNVTPAFLRAIRTEVLNHTLAIIDKDTAAESWVTEALSDDRLTPEALGKVLDDRFGSKRVVHDPSDPEANKIATARGYTVIAPRSLPKGVSAFAREHDLLKAAGQVTPSPRPYDTETGFGDDRRAVLDPEKWTPEIVAVVEYAKALAVELLGATIGVEIVSDNKVRSFAACYRPGHLELNLRVLGHGWFAAGPNETVTELLIHEFVHHTVIDHLSSDYYDGLSRLGARCVNLALSKPEFFTDHGYVT